MRAGIRIPVDDDRLDEIPQLVRRATQNSFAKKDNDSIAQSDFQDTGQPVLQSHRNGSDQSIPPHRMASGDDYFHSVTASTSRLFRQHAATASIRASYLH
jgi:hypothetical protein